MKKAGGSRERKCTAPRNIPFYKCLSGAGVYACDFPSNVEFTTPINRCPSAAWKLMGSDENVAVYVVKKKVKAVVSHIIIKKSHVAELQSPCK